MTTPARITSTRSANPGLFRVGEVGLGDDVAILNDGITRLPSLDLLIVLLPGVVVGLNVLGAFFEPCDDDIKPRLWSQLI